jgi:hypothetical protein
MTDVLNRFLLVITPGSQASLLAGALAVVAFFLGILEMLSRNFTSAGVYLYLSIGIVAYVSLLRFFSYRASHRIVDRAQAQIRQHVQNMRLASVGSDAPNAEQVRRQERAHMTELSSDLKSALQSLPADSPMRPKYEATVEWLERALAKGG